MKRVDRREAFGLWASGLATLAAACEQRGVNVVQTADGPVYQLEKDEMLVLVSGVQPVYHPGERVSVTVLLNNQSSRFATARIRTRLVGRGQQAVVEAEVVQVNVRPSDATTTERFLNLPNDLPPGDYSVQVEIPPWSFEGRQAGGGALNAPVKVQPS